MALTAMGLGTKQASDNVNLDPQRQFWSWLTSTIHPDDKSADSNHHQRAYFSGFAATQTSPAGMSIQIGGGDEADSAAIILSNGLPVLLSTDSEPQTATIPTAPASGSRIDAVVSYIDTTSPDPESETPGTPEYVHTIVVSGAAASSPSAPTDAQIVSALPAGAGGTYYRWCDVKVTANQTTITNSNITDRKPASPNLYWTTSGIEQIANNVVGNWNNVATKQVSGGFGKTIGLCRVGNIVMAVSSGGTSFSPAGQWTNLSQTMPSGFRPAYSSSGLMSGACPGTANPCFQTIAHDGSMSQIVMNHNSSQDYRMVGVWYTTDAWPS